MRKKLGSVDGSEAVTWSAPESSLNCMNRTAQSPTTSLSSWSFVRTSYEVCCCPLSMTSRESTNSSKLVTLGTSRMELKTSSEKADNTCSFTTEMAVSLGSARKMVDLWVLTRT